MSLPKMHCFLVVAGALWLARPAQAGQEPAPAITWQASYQAALDQAKASGKPVLIALNLTDEEACDDLALNTYAERRIVMKTRKFVPLVACAQAHREYQDEKSGRMVCSRFGSVRCQDHIDVELAVRAAFFAGEEEVLAPQHIILLPDGKPMAIRPWWMTQRQLEKLLDSALDVARRPGAAERLERQHLIAVLDSASSGDQLKREDALIELTYALGGWSRDLALDLVRSRAPASVRQGLVNLLPELGPNAETALLGLLDDPIASIRQQVVGALGTDLSEQARERLGKRMATERDQRVRRSINSVLPTPPARGAAGR